MPRLKLILNPQADHGHAAALHSDLRQILEEEARLAAQNGHSYDFDWVVTAHPRHAIDLAQQAAAEGADAIVAIGGDGTVHEIVNGLMQLPAEQRPALGVIPVGSGNDFAHNLGLPDDPREAARCVLGEITRLIDVGLIKDGSGREEYWDNTIGIGFSGAVNIATRSKTRLRGFVMYLVSVLETIFLRSLRMQAVLQIDNGAPASKAISMLSVCNGPREGGGFPVAPDAKMDDGLASYTIMRDMSRFMMLRFLPVVLNAQHTRYPRYFETGTARQIRIETDTTMAIHTDGEVFGPWEAGIRQVEVGIIPAAIRVLCRCC